MHWKSEFATLSVLVCAVLFANVLVQSSPAPDHSYETQWRSRREAAAEPEAEPESSSAASAKAASEPEPESSSMATPESEPAGNSTEGEKKKGFFENVGDNIKKAGDNIKSGASAAMDKVKSAAEKAKDSAKKAVNNVATKVKEATDPDPTTMKPCNTTATGSFSAVPLNLKDVNCTMQDVKNKAEGMMDDMTGNSSSTESSSEKKSKRSSDDNNKGENNDNQSGKSGQSEQSGQSGQSGKNEQSDASSTESSSNDTVSSSVSSKPGQSQNDTESAPSTQTKAVSNYNSQIGNNTDSEEVEVSNSSNTRVIKSPGKESENEETFPSTKHSKRTKHKIGESDDNEPILRFEPDDVTINSDESLVLKEKNVTTRDTTVPTLPPLGPYPNLKKPGKCPPLAPGQSCVALSNDAAQCRTDSGCQGTKKCCFFACQPYKDVGVCETPYYYSSSASHYKH